MNAFFPKLTLKSRFLFAVLWLTALTALPLTSAATVFTFTKGNSTTFANGNYVAGTMDVDFTQSTPSLTSVNLSLYDSSDVLITNFTTPVSGTVRSNQNTCLGAGTTVYRFVFGVWGNPDYLYTVVHPSNTTAPMPGLTGERTENATSKLTSTTCAEYLSPPTPTASIPTLGEWGMIFMASLIAMFGIRRMRISK